MPQLHVEGMTALGREGLEGAALGQTRELLLQAAPWRAGKDFWNWSLIPSLPSAVSFSKHSGNSGAHGKVRVCFRLSWLGVLYLESQAACAHSAVRWRVGRALRQREQTCRLNVPSYRLICMGDNTGFFSKFENRKEKAVVLIFGVSRVLAKFWTVSG